jgi:predicted negative regulator of RcsB-dependent stress response
MADHLEDDEQLEALKRWWAENGRSTVAAVVLAVGGTLGWQQYQIWTDNQAATAADAWASAQAQLASENALEREQGEAAAQAIISEFSDSTYALFAGLQLAKLAVEEGDLTPAERYLRDALAISDPESELGQLVQLRLARVMAANGDESGALAILSQSGDAMPVAYATARGDIHLAAGRQQEALSAYMDARTASLELGNPPGLLDAKITSLSSRLSAQEQSS